MIGGLTMTTQERAEMIQGSIADRWEREETECEAITRALQDIEAMEPIWTADQVRRIIEAIRMGIVK